MAQLFNKNALSFIFVHQSELKNKISNGTPRYQNSRNLYSICPIKSILFLIRHGPPLYTEIILGQQDIPLSQAFRGKKIEMDLFNVHDPIVISSPLKRSIETAKLFGFNDPVIDARISEMNLGLLQGKQRTQENLTALMDLNLSPDMNDHEGESVNEFARRVQEFYNDYRNEERPVIVFTHAGVIRMIATQIHNLQPINYNPNYFEIVEINEKPLSFTNRQIQIASS